MIATSIQKETHLTDDVWVDTPVHYPQCYLYSQKEVDFSANEAKVKIALFGAKASLQSASQAAKVIASITPGYIISRAEYEIIQKVLREIP